MQSMLRNPYLCLAVVAGLVSAILVGMTGEIMLAVYDRPIPAALGQVTAVAMGALASILVAIGPAGTGLRLVEQRAPERPEGRTGNP